MHAIAIFAVNEHLMQLQAEAAQRRMLRAGKPGRVATLVSALRSAITPRVAPTGTSPA